MKFRMKNILTVVALSFTVILNAQWIKDTSCNKKAKIIMTLTTPANASEPYKADPPSVNISTLSTAEKGILLILFATPP